MMPRGAGSFVRIVGGLALTLTLPLLRAAEKPVPRAQVLPLPHHEASLHRDGLELARLHFAPDLLRPFVYPVIGPSGRSLTRMGHPHDPVTHSHHNSVWVSHHDINGVSFWDDRGRGHIQVKHAERYEDGPDEAAAVTVAQWLADGVPVLNERRRTAMHLLPDGEWLLLIDLHLTPAGDQPVTLGKTPFGLLGVRLAKTIGVRDGGGTIRNSAGGKDEKEVFWKPARWVDYSGPMTASAREGITLMDHPANPNHPSVFHVRDDGWMGASLTFAGPLVLKPGDTLRLRYGLYVHAGIPPTEAIQRRWEAFTALPQWPSDSGGDVADR